MTRSERGRLSLDMKKGRAAGTRNGPDDNALGEVTMSTTIVTPTLPPLPVFAPVEQALRDLIQRPNLTKPGEPCQLPCDSTTPCEWTAFPEHPTEWTRVHTQVIGRTGYKDGISVLVETYESCRDGRDGTWWDTPEIRIEGPDLTLNTNDAIVMANLLVRASSACLATPKGC